MKTKNPRNLSAGPRKKGHSLPKWRVCAYNLYLSVLFQCLTSVRDSSFPDTCQPSECSSLCLLSLMTLHFLALFPCSLHICWLFLLPQMSRLSPGVTRGQQVLHNNLTIGSWYLSSCSSGDLKFLVFRTAKLDPFSGHHKFKKLTHTKSKPGKCMGHKRVIFS